MPRLTRRYLAEINALPWPTVLQGLGVTPPKHDLGATAFMMSCSANDRSPSMRFDRRGFFHCFSCGGSGDVFGFVLRYLATEGAHHDYKFSPYAADPFSRGKRVIEPRAHSQAINHFARKHAIGRRKPPACQ
ncbi:CHC2 zinc finger domain-containing protein [Bosea sp. ANAM02]|uniref:CHC2 zinc finger domain-containing protein n=1 Tax=Bosea sp. ANAM02 TaxID=2020412 RepID=UPI00140E9FFD|nr:CHC2 zinc finger domain-containing protein [Bosea sp. ANAM02]BCB21874.1 hypothetical protein OCUBac02_47680 [Bosea sp. ANAM02]